MSQRSAMGFLFGFLMLAFGQPGAAAEPDLRALLQTRLEVAREGYRVALEEFDTGKAPWSQLAGWSQRWLDAQLAVDPSTAATAREAHLGRLKQAETTLVARQQKGEASLKDVLDARYQRLDVEIELARATTQVSLYPPGTSPPPASIPAPKDRAVIAVRLPTNAELRFDGVRAAQNAGSYRRFVVDNLVPGVSYTFELRASWTESGAEVAPAPRRIHFQGGDRVEVDFTQPEVEKLPAPK